MKVSLRTSAVNDIKAAAIYYRRRAGPETALEFVETLEDAINHLRQHPGAAQPSDPPTRSHRPGVSERTGSGGADGPGRAAPAAARQAIGLGPSGRRGGLGAVLGPAASGSQAPERERKGSMVAEPTSRRSASREGMPKPPMTWGGTRQVKST